MASSTYPHLALRLKKEYNYTSTPPLGLHDLLKGVLYLLPSTIEEYNLMINSDKLIGTTEHLTL